MLRSDGCKIGELEARLGGLLSPQVCLWKERTCGSVNRRWVLCHLFYATMLQCPAGLPSSIQNWIRLTLATLRVAIQGGSLLSSWGQNQMIDLLMFILYINPHDLSCCYKYVVFSCIINNYVLGMTFVIVTHKMCSSMLSIKSSSLLSSLLLDNHSRYLMSFVLILCSSSHLLKLFQFLSCNRF